MTKRTASYDIDPKTFEYKEKEPSDDSVQDRTIFKIKRTPDQQPSAKSQSKPSFVVPGLFAKLNDKQDREKTEKQDESAVAAKFSKPSTSAGTFANLFSGMNTTSLFSQNKQTSSIKSLFNNSQLNKKEAQPSEQNEPKSTEQNKPASFGSIFGFKPQFNFFNNQGINTPPASIFSKKNEDQEGDSDSLERGQIMEANPSESKVKFDYPEECKVLKSVQIKKFKKDKGDLIDSPNKITLLLDPKEQIYYLNVLSKITHTKLYSGLLLPGKSQVKVLNNNPDNLEIRTFNMNSQKKLENHIIKIQIFNEKETDSADLLAELKKIEENKVEAKSEQKNE